MDGSSVFLRFNQLEAENHFWQFLDAVRGVSVPWLGASTFGGCPKNDSYKWRDMGAL